MYIEFLQKRIGQVGCTANLLAELADTSAGTLSKLLNGTTNSADLRNKVERALSGLEKLQSVSHPLPIDWSKAAILKDIVRKLQDGDMTISVVDNEPPEKLRGYVIRLGPNQGYYQRNRKGEIVAVLNQFQGILVGKEVAEQLVKLLAEKGYRPSVEECTTGDLESISLELSADVWPVEEKVA